MCAHSADFKCSGEQAQDTFAIIQIDEKDPSLASALVFSTADIHRLKSDRVIAPGSLASPPPSAIQDSTLLFDVMLTSTTSYNTNCRELMSNGTARAKHTGLFTPGILMFSCCFLELP